jgi:geranylgeranyl diphosphate synthase type I
MREVLETWRPVVDEEIARLLPRVFDDDYLADRFGAPTHEYDTAALQSALADPVWDLLDRGGKRWRAVVCLHLIDGFGEDPEGYLPYAVIPEVLHNGTIIVDDVEDGAQLRRGDPALHHEFGADVALNAGNALYFLPLKVVADNPADLAPAERLRAWEMLTDELNRTHLGQGVDIHWHNGRVIEATEPAYLEMCACKTGCLGRILARLAAIVTGQSEAVERQVARYAENMSVAFQIGDDILDIEHTLDEAGAFGKAPGNDIREGKKTLLVIHAAREADPADRERLADILWADGTTDEEVREAIDILQSTGSIAYARERAHEFAAAARAELDDVDLDPDVKADLRAFTEFVIDREA